MTEAQVDKKEIGASLGEVAKACGLLGIGVDYGQSEGWWYANVSPSPYPPYYPDGYGQTEAECAERFLEHVRGLIARSFRAYEYVHHRAHLKDSSYLERRMDDYFKRGGMGDSLGIGPRAKGYPK